MTIEISGNTQFCAAEGIPSLRMAPQQAQSGFWNHFTWANRWSSRRMYRKNSTVTMTWARVVAMAAPATPMAGMGPKPKISSGSSTMLNTSPTAMTIKGVRLLPVVVIKAVKI